MTYYFEIFITNQFIQNQCEIMSIHDCTYDLHRVQYYAQYSSIICVKYIVYVTFNIWQVINVKLRKINFPKIKPCGTPQLMLCSTDCYNIKYIAFC